MIRPNNFLGLRDKECRHKHIELNLTTAVNLDEILN
jgi:hypothetical protein